MKNIIILGSGPAGVSAALYTKRAGIDTTIIHKGMGALEKAHAIENYYGIYPSLTGAQIHQIGIDQALALGVNIIKEEVFNIEFNGNYNVVTESTTHCAGSIIIATGTSRTSSRIKGISDYEGKGVSYCATCDGFFHRNKDVAVLGSGDYAIHEAMHLVPIANSVTLLTDGESAPSEVPEGILIDTRKIKEAAGDKLHIKSIKFEDGDALEISGLFIALGTAGSSDLARKVGVIIDGNKIVTDENMATNLPGLFAAGDATSKMLQIAAGVYQGAQAATSAIKYLRSKNSTI